MRRDGTVVFGGIASSASGESNASGPPRPRGQFCDAYEASLIIAKNREAPTGEVPLIFHKECMRFSNARFDEPGF
jgi:replicative DNA helicase